jgi:putative transposase
VSVADLCRKHGVSDASIHKWKAKFGGMDGETEMQMIL